MGAEKNLERDQFELLIQGLIENEYGCCDDFLSTEITAGLRTNITLLNAEGLMESAGIGNKLGYKKDNLVRNDKVNWIEDQSSNPFEEAYLSKVWRFIEHLNTTCFTSVKSFESHYSTFQVGNFYKRHLDQFQNEKGRKFSIVLYLNQEWHDADEGKLSLYPSTGQQIDVSPMNGRMVFFRSDQLEHEVRPSPTRERNSIAGWLKD